MPVTNRDGGRVEFREPLTPREAEMLARDADLEVLQCAGDVSAGTARMLDEAVFVRRPGVEMRVYGGTEDLGFAAAMPHVERFAADCLRFATNVEAIAELPALRSLSLGIFELESFAVLDRLNPEIERLTLGATRRKADLGALARLSNLRLLDLVEQQRNIEALSRVTRLEQLVLRSVSASDVAFLRPLANLWSLAIKLGGTNDLEALRGMRQIKYLELWQVRDLGDLDFVSELSGLQNLFLQTLVKVRALPSFLRSEALRRVWVENMKGLHDFSSLEWAPALEEFVLVEGLKQHPDELLPVLRNPTLRRATAGFGSATRNMAFERLRLAHGIGQFVSAPFQYR